jgi:hypothetical protein
MKVRHLLIKRMGWAFKLSLLLFAFSNRVNAQCIASSNSPTGTITVSPYIQTCLSGNMFPGSYTTFSVTTSGQYAILTSFGTYVTVTDNANTPLYFGFGTTLYTGILTPGLYRVHIHNNASCSISGGSRIVCVAPRNNAFSFDGVNDHMNLGTALTSSLSGSTKLTVEAWVNPGTMTNLGCIVGNYNTTVTGLQFLLRRSTGSFYEFWVGNGGTWNQVTSSATPTTGVWQHVAATWDGSVSRIYVNGVLSGTVATTISSLGNGANNPVWIGANGINENFNGEIDEVRIWNRALCLGEILNNKNGPIPTTSAGLIANYHFNQGVAAGSNPTVTSLIDDSGNNINGTVTAAALTGSSSNWVGSGSYPDNASISPFVSPSISVSGPTSVCSGNTVTLTASGNVSTYNWTSGPATATNAVSPGATTTYSVIGTNSLGCTSNMATYIVAVNTTPTVSVNSGSVCAGNPFTITPSGAFSYTIQGGSTVVTPTANTNYTVIGSSSAGCVSANTATSNVTMGTCSLAEALNTDGSNDYITIPKSISSDFTIEYWMKTTATGQTGPQWYFGNGLVDAEVGGVTNDFGTALVGNQVAFGIGNPDVSIFSTSNVNNGNWTHVAATWKQSTGEMKLYINGVLENTGTSGTALRTSPPDIKIGVLGTLLRYLNVNIDELRVWSTVRSACEINTYKNCEIPTSATGLVANYHFNQGYAANPNPGVTTLTDISGNSNNGTLLNFALTGTSSNWIAPGGVITGSTTPLPAPTVGSTISNSVICFGNSTTLSGTGASTYTWSGGISDGVAFSPTATASYTVTGTATTGCTNTAVNSVTVNPLPSVAVNSGSICMGSNFTMVPSGAATYTYSSGSAVVSPTTNTSYTVTGTDALGCSANAVSNVTVNICSAAEALNFDGIDDHVNLGTGINSAISALNKITVEAWVKPSTTSGPYRIIVGNYSTPANQMQFCLRQQNTGYVFFIGNGSLGNYLNVLAANSVTTGVWQHVAGTWDGSVASIYINGVLSNTASITYPSFGTTTNSVIIGINSVPEQWSGGIDEVRIWNRTVCQGEILNNMNGEIPTNATGLIANYHFNQGVAGQPNPTVTMLNDASSSAYTGTLTNMALNGTTSNWIAPGAVTVAVTPFVSPTVAITGANAVCAGTSATLTANGNVTSYSWVSGPATASNVVAPSVTTTYSVTGSDMGCVSNVATHTLTVNANPTITVNSGAICSGSSFTMTPSGASTYTFSGGNAVVSPTATTSYTVDGTDANGCTNVSSAISSVTVNSLPTVNASTSSSVICTLPTQQTATLSATGAITYTWSNSTNGSSTAVSPSVTTTYTVTGTDANGCENMAVITQSVGTCAGIANVNGNNAAISVYPNPNNGLFILEVRDMGLSTQFVVVNVLGEVVLSEPVTQEKTQINIADLKSGIYFVEVYQNNTRQVIKLIKE